MAHLAWGFGGRSSPDGGIFAKVDQGDRQALRVRRGRGAWRSSARKSRRQREGFARRGGPGKASGGSSKGGSAGRGDVERAESGALDRAEKREAWRRFMPNRAGRM